MYSHWDTVRGLPSPRAWAYRVAFNLGNSLFRRKLAEHRAHPYRRRAAPARTDRADVLDVRAAVTALPVGQRSALILRYYADLSVAEAAQALGCSPGTVKSQTHEALRPCAATWVRPSRTEPDRERSRAGRDPAACAGRRVAPLDLADVARARARTGAGGGRWRSAPWPCRCSPWPRP